MSDAVNDCLRYFSQFSYAPSFDEIYIFLKMKITRKNLELEIGNLIKKGQLKAFKFKDSGEVRYCLSKAISRSGKYTLGEYSINNFRLKTQMSPLRPYKKIWDFEGQAKIKEDTSLLKLQKAQQYITLLSLFPQIKLIGISGSVAMSNAKDSDDIDLFIISAHDRIWTARFISLVLSQFMGIRRRYGEKTARDKICLNLFFDERYLTVPKHKRSEYVAHEVLQMKPIIVKDDIYTQYLDSNKWVYDIFPNANLRLTSKNLKLEHKNLNFLELAIEILLKQIQLFFINRHRTSELISDTQLWFHPDDYERKIKS